MINPTKKTWLGLLLTLIAALSLLVAACGGDDDDGGGDSSGPSDTAEPTATETTDAGGNGDNSGDTPDFSQLSSEWQNVEARITYEFTSTDSSGETTTKMTLYNKPPNSRMDYEDTSTGDVTTFIQTKDTSYTCGSGQCISSPSDGAQNPIPFFGAFAAPEALAAYAGLAGFDTGSSNEKIAGMSAKCFSLSQGGSDLKWCFGDNGILLLSDSKDSTSETSMLATDVSTDVSDSDFEPPYPVAEIPGQ